MRRFTAVLVSAVLVIAAAAVFEADAPPAEAAVPSEFDPGNIISDALFFDGQAMSAGQVQAFLDSQVPSCRAGYTCLKNYVQSTPYRAAEAGRCDAYGGAPNESAATIIYRVGVVCGVSQKVMLVLLQKEQGLITDDWPTERQYRSATGYGCPDTSDCDSTYYGFFNQVYMAALQFKRYAANPTGWRHVAGRTVNVLFHPNAACGSSPVYIQNQATAGLYNYTPYQPNAAALANLYGTGDGCSAYGNRNFWRMYTDWFGSTKGSALVRTASNPTVYLIVGKMRHAVPDLAMLQALYPIGGVTYVSQSYIDGFENGPRLGRIVRSPAGKVYFLDAGAKLQFMTCTDVIAFGIECGASILLTDAQIAAFRTGPSMSRLYSTPEGKRFLIEAGKRREVADNSAATNLPSSGVTLYEAAIQYLGYGAPIIETDRSIAARSAADRYLWTGGVLNRIGDSVLNQTPLRSAFPLRSLDGQSIAFLQQGAELGTYLESAQGERSMLTSAGRVSLDRSAYPDSMFKRAPDALLSRLPVVGAAPTSHFVKEASNASVYYVENQVRRKALDWGAYEALVAGGAAATIWVVPDGSLASLPLGQPLAGLRPGTLVKSATQPRIYFVDDSRLLSVPSFAVLGALGINSSYAVVPEATITSYERSSWLAGPGVRCGVDMMVGIGGGLGHLPDEPTASAYGLEYTQLGAQACSQLKRAGVEMTQFIRSSSGKIYWIDQGKKNPIQSWDALVRLGGVDRWVQVSDDLVNLIPTGADVR
ncbi:hypothetical protein ACWKWP_06865 [Agromyces soli]